MNKNFKNSAENSADENISTKKGFRISLSGKKKSEGVNSKSTINFSSPQTEGSQNFGAKNNNTSNEGKNGRSKEIHSENGRENNKFKNSKHFAKPNKLEKSVKFDNSDRLEKEKTEKNDRNERNEHNDRNGRNNQSEQKKEKNRQNKKPFRQKHGKKDIGNYSDEKQQRDFVQKNQKPYVTESSEQSARASERSEQNNRGTFDKIGKKNQKNRQNQNQSRDKHREYSAEPTKTTPLSALSGDLQSLNLLKDYKAQSAKETALDNRTLEEKYKNAIPLAEKIAAEDEKARRPIFSAAGESCEKQEIVGIRFREAGKIYYFDPDGAQIPFGTHVIVETARGSEYGFTAISNRFIPKDSVISPLKKIERIATCEDTRKYTANKMLEKQAEDIFKEKVAALKLEMNLVYVEYTFDNSKLLFYFTAETRIDFRELVKELAGIFRTRIELRQIGVRDEAKAIGCLGVCGRSACCSSYLGDFAQVSIKMAKDQNLSLNAAKISGACGKLMCCLRYEDKVYEQENARTPKIGAIVETPDGKGTVTDRNALRATVSVSLETAPDAPPKSFSRDDVRVIGFDEKHYGEHSDNDDSADEIKDENT